MCGRAGDEDERDNESEYSRGKEGDEQECFGRYGVRLERVRDRGIGEVERSFIAFHAIETTADRCYTTAGDRVSVRE